MLSNHHIETTFPQISEDHKDIVFELRNLIFEIAPDAAEVTHSKGFSYFHANRGGPVSAGICQIGIFPDHIRLAFIHGAFLPDPLGLLEGTCLAKRYLKIFSFSSAPWDAIKELITISSKFDPYSLQQPYTK